MTISCADYCRNGLVVFHHEYETHDAGAIGFIRREGREPVVAFRNRVAAWMPRHPASLGAEKR